MRGEALGRGTGQPDDPFQSCWKGYLLIRLLSLFFFGAVFRQVGPAFDQVTVSALLCAWRREPCHRVQAQEQSLGEPQFSSLLFGLKCAAVFLFSLLRLLSLLLSHLSKGSWHLSHLVSHNHE